MLDCFISKRQGTDEYEEAIVFLISHIIFTRGNEETVLQRATSLIAYILYDA